MQIRTYILKALWMVDNWLENLYWTTSDYDHGSKESRPRSISLKEAIQQITSDVGIWGKGFIEKRQQHAGGDLRAPTLKDGGGDFDKGVEAYINALKADPEDIDTKKNLTMALQQLQQQRDSAQSVLMIIGPKSPKHRVLGQQLLLLQNAIGT